MQLRELVDVQGEALTGHGSIYSITSVSIADVGGATEPTVTTSAKDTEQKGVVITFNGTSATAGQTYTVTVTIMSTDSQTFIRKGRLQL